MSTDRESLRYAEYLICKRRGHQPSNFVTASIPPQNVCKWCGTYYWNEAPKMREHSAPAAPLGEGER